MAEPVELVASNGVLGAGVGGETPCGDSFSGLQFSIHGNIWPKRANAVCRCVGGCSARR